MIKRTDFSPKRRQLRTAENGMTPPCAFTKRNVATDAAGAFPVMADTQLCQYTGGRCTTVNR